MIPVHNCASLLERVLPAVIDEFGDRSDVQIEVIDDGSSDDPRSVVEHLGHGRVSFFRVDQPSGAVANFNRCIERSTGQYVHLLHGDDVVLPGFYEAMERVLDGSTADAAFSRARYIDVDDNPLSETRSERRGTGSWNDALSVLCVSNRVRPPGAVVRRATYERIGGFREDLPHAADWEMWARIAAYGEIVFVDEILAAYRVHGGSDTAQRVRTADNVRERVEAIKIVNQLVPPERRRTSIRRALGYSAVFASRTALGALRRGDIRAALAQGRAAVSCILLTASRRE